MGRVLLWVNLLINTLRQQDWAGFSVVSTLLDTSAYSENLNLIDHRSYRAMANSVDFYKGSDYLKISYLVYFLTFGVYQVVALAMDHSIQIKVI